MKFLPSQLAYLTTDREARVNLRALVRYLGFLVGLVTVYAVVFHVIKLEVEQERHSWVTGFYWTLVVMTTLGFGDITFTSDIGRVFSIVVLLSGVVFLLVMLPFLFIRLFYAPWLEARVRLRAPKEVPAGTRGHVIIAEYDAIAAGLVERCVAESIPYVVLEPDPSRAGQLIGEGVVVLAGESDNRLTQKSVGKRDQFGPELVYFSDCILNDRTPEPSGEEGLQDVRIVQALYKSAASGKPVSIPSSAKDVRPTIRQRITRPGVRKPQLVKVQSASVE